MASPGRRVATGWPGRVGLPLLSPRGLAPLLAMAALAALAAVGCGGDSTSLTVYSGRSEELVGPLLKRFSQDTGIELRVRYGDTAGLAATILEEGDNSPADVFFAQDPSALGALAQEGILAPLPDSLLRRVDPRFRSPAGLWVGTSGRARVVAYNMERLTPEELPDSIWGFTEPQWRGRIGWPPTNGSFQAFVTALRVTEGEEKARQWLEAIQANDPQVYANNVAALEAVARGEVDVAFVNHYYLFRFLAEEGEGFPARNYFLPAGDAGSLVSVAGVAILKSSNAQELALRLVEYLLSPPAQEYFAQQTLEYPLVEGVAADPRLPPLRELNPPNIDLGDLSDLRGTLDLLRETGVLP